MILVALAASAALPAGRAAAVPLPSDKVAEPAVMGGPGDIEYLRKIHAHVHKRWADNFLALIGQNLEASNPLNDPNRVAEADIVIGADGKLVSATITRSSGFAGFDDAVPEVLKDSSPFPVPPVAARSDDDKLHLRWVFARNERRCSGLTILHVDDPLEIAIPKLMKAGRRDEIVARVVAARAAGTPAEPAVSALAGEWLRGAGKAPYMNLRIAGVLAGRGDADAITWLKGALKRPVEARAAGAILAANKVPVCPVVKADLEGANANAQFVAALALSTAGDAACAPGLVKMLENGKLKPDARAAAATALGPIEDEAAKTALSNAAKDEPNLTVKAAASLAQIRPNAGRAKMLSMVRLLKEPSIEMRAAGCAGVVRAGGDSDFDDLYMLFKDTDPRPGEATLRELENVPTAKATEYIGKLMKRPLVSMQRMAAELLIKRHAKASFPALKAFLEPPSSDPALRGMALVAADDAQLAKLAGDPKMGIWVYRALLARSERDRASDWLLGQLSTMDPAAQADAMADWLATAEPPAANASKGKK
jgi:HEAT repeat protein